jgi:alanine dehydrogenase
MPGAYLRTSTLALTTTTLPYAMQLAEKGIEALREDQGFAKGVTTHQGALTCKPAAETLGLMPQFKAFFTL